jgi:anti-anti-sigma regulatory factor
MSHDPLSGLMETPADAEVAQAQEAAEATAESVFALPDTLTITDVGTLHKAFLPRLDQGTALVLDGQAVERVDGAGLQLLTAVFKEAAARQLPVHWHAASEALRRGAAELGVDRLLGLGDDRAA